MSWHRQARSGSLLLAALLSHALSGPPAAGAPPSEQERHRLEELIARLTSDLHAARTELMALDADTPAPPGDRPSAHEPTFFRQIVEPILDERCYRCHGALKQRAGLRLDSRQAMLLGGDGGAALVPGEAEASRLIRAVRRVGDLEMPPSEPLPPQEIQALEAWVAAGAPWPAVDAPMDAVERPRSRAVPAVVADFAPGPPVGFNRDVRPILAAHCFECHGPDERTRQAGLRLDDPESAFAVLASDRRALVPGDLAQSQLFQRIAAKEAADRMPPPHHPKPLSREQVEVLGRFILQGARWEPHWAFVEPQHTEPPAVRDADWAHNEIDRFVLSRLEQEGIAPSPEADRRTLARRLALDLTGLPPSPDDVEALLSDPEPDALERYIDDRLASPRYGEHMARYWLDAARYADTNGYHIDNERYMWRWREWVIDAYNRNAPFDEFTVAQLAGDLLPNAGFEDRLATGFHRNHMINFEGGAIPEEYRTQYVFDRVDTTATIWLGLTVECAKCHDHKFDPVSQREYYRFAAFFNSIEEQGLDGREGNAEPYMAAPDESQRAREASLLAELEPYHALLDAPRPRIDGAQRAWRAEWRRKLAEKWRPLDSLEVRSLGAADVEHLADGSVLLSGESPDTDTIEITGVTSLGRITAIRLEALRDPSLPSGGFGRSPADGDFVLTELEVEAAAATRPFGGDRIAFAYAVTDREGQRAALRRALDGDEATGWSANHEAKPTKRTIVFVPEQPFGSEDGSRLRIRLHHDSVLPRKVIGRFRVTVTEAAEMALSEAGPWWWNGPYGSDAFDSAADPAREIDLDGRYLDGRRRWVEWTHGDDDLALGTGSHLLYRELEAPTGRTAHYRLRADAARFWLNGEKVHECLDAPACGDDEVQLPLRPGRNRLLAQVLSEPPPEPDKGPGGSLGFRFTLLEETGTTPFGLEAMLATDDAQLTPHEGYLLRRHYRRNHWPAWETHEERFVQLEDELATLRAEIPTTMVMAEREEPRPTFVLRRGQYDQQGEHVEAGVPAILPPLAETASPGRLDLARWLVRPDHPITARVAVNRVWARLFGRGLVGTVEDFGVQGELPSHPELLDWLALRFVESGWDVKALQRLMVASATYRQSSAARPELQSRDPENRLLARAARLRLDGEVIRDAALAVSGLLVEKRGGPSVNPYQPPGLWREIGYRSAGRFSAGEFVRGDGQDLYRRSLYTFWKRTVPPPNMLVFDAPNRETCTVQRGRSNTPLQALVLLNDPQYVEAARAFAERILSADGPGVEQRLDRAFRLALSRPPDTAELSALVELLDDQRQYFRGAESAAELLLAVGDKPLAGDLRPAELAAWTVVTSVILNLDETITRT